jgi:hypothetical protein
MIGSIVAIVSGCFVVALYGNRRLFDRVVCRHVSAQYRFNARFNARFSPFGKMPPEAVWVKRRRVTMLAGGSLFILVGLIGLAELAFR